MEPLPYPGAAHVVGSPNFHAQDNIESAGNSQPKRPPLGDTGTERLLYSPSAVHLVESCRPQGRYNDDVESGSPRNEPTPNHTAIPHRQSAQALLNTLSVAKAIQTRASQLFRLPDVAQAVQIRIRRLRSFLTSSEPYKHISSKSLRFLRSPGPCKQASSDCPRFLRLSELRDDLLKYQPQLRLHHVLTCDQRGAVSYV